MARAVTLVPCDWAEASMPRATSMVESMVRA